MGELSDAKIRNAKPAEKQYTIADGQGLSILVRPNGTKLWLYRYRFGGKRKTMSFGTIPAVGLKVAREKREAAAQRLLPIETLHAKIVCADERIAYVGSANLLGSSESISLETGFLVEGQPAIQAVRWLDGILRIARTM